MKGKGNRAVSRARKPSLFARVVALIEEARQKVATVANIAQVYTNYEIGRQIVEEEQGGKRRAEYGKQVLIDLSQKLTARFGRGWSAENLRKMRTFFLMYSEIHNGVVEFGHEEIHNSVVEIQGDRKYATVLRKSDLEDSANTVYEIADAKDSVNSVSPIPKFTLSWSHYLLLMRIVDPVERAFYEREATQGNWSFRQLERMYRTSTFERLQISKDKAKVRALMNRPAPDVEVAGEALKDPVVTEFLGTPDKYSEGELEDRIFDHIQDFMLEMGKGFLFEARQKRFTFEERHFYVDLVLYNRLLQCYVLVDLKMDDLTHQDLGQMQMYVNYYDRYVKEDFEKPTIGILLCERKNDALVELTLPKDANVYAQQYALCLPDKALLQQKLREWIAEFKNKEDVK